MSWNNYIKSISEVCEVIAGQSPEGKFYNKEGRGLPFYQGKKEFTEREIGEPTTWTTKITKEAIEGDILMSVRAPVGPINLSTQLICIGRGLAAIRASEKVDKDYLFYFLLKHEAEIVGNVGAVFNSINKTQIGNIKIPIPPLSEQKQIVEILDEAFAAIDQAKANIEKNIQNAKELFQSKLNDIFSHKGESWKEQKLKDICTLINGRAYKKPELLSEGKYPVLRVGNLFTNNQWYYSDLELNEDKYIEKNDLIYAWSASFGPRIWKKDKVIYHYHIWKVVPNVDKVSKDFLFLLLDWDTEKIKLAHGTGTTMIHVSKGSMEGRILPLPPIETQPIIADQVKKLRYTLQELTSTYLKKLQNLEELKKSILQKAFSGELTNKTVEV